MYKKTIAILLVMLLFLLSGCQSGTTDVGTNTLNPDEELTLTVYSLPGNMLLDTCIKEFSRTYQNIKIEKTVFDDADQFDETLANELNAGKGPDIILFTSMTKLDMKKMAQNGAFASLSQYMDVDENPINYDDYITGVFDAGRFEEEQYLMPLSVLIPLLLYQTDGEYAFEPAPVISFDEFKESVQTELVRLQKEEQKAVLSKTRLLSDIIIETSQIVHFSEEENQYVYDEAKFKETADFIKDLYTDNLERAEGIFQKYGDTYKTNLQNFTFSLYYPLDFPFEAKINNGMNVALSGKEIGISVFEYENGTVPAQLSIWGAVNANAGEKERYAYEFLRTALNMKIHAGQMEMCYMPVNKLYAQERIKTLKGEVWKYQNNGVTVHDLGFSDEMEANLTAIVDRINHIELINYTLFTIFENSFTPYFEEKETYEECLQDFKNRLQIYATE